jgi:hypothetical protein
LWKIKSEDWFRRLQEFFYRGRAKEKREKRKAELQEKIFEEKQAPLFFVQFE